MPDKRALCLACADLDHLAFLASGDAALTRRARKYSTLSVVVLKWSCARKRYERQGLLAEEDALTKAEEECLADFDLRARRQARVAERRETEDLAYQAQFAQRLRELFPGCPAGREQKIAEHACLKYSGRVGRSAAAKQVNEAVIRLAVIAHIRHRETSNDKLLMRGYDRSEARAEIQREVTIKESFYVSGETVYEDAVKLIVEHELQEMFHDRCREIVTRSSDSGYGFHDQLSYVYRTYLS